MKRQPKQRSPRPDSPRVEGAFGAGAEVEVEIERIVPGGAGLAHAAGHTLFVTLAAPGDRVRVRVERVRGKVAFASILEIITPAPVRVEPPCPYFGRCGGCDFQQLTYEAQLEAKAEIIRDCLRRIARIEPPASISVMPSPAVWRYRSRARWQHDPVRQFLGYYELASHRVCDVAECPVVLPEVQTKLSHLRATLAAGEFDETEEFQAVAGDDGVSLLPPLEAADAAERFRILAGERYRFDASCFFQINHALLEPLLHAALKHATGGATAIDLYCGVGLFTLPLARRYARVVGVEGNAAATAFARLNLADARLANNAEIKTARVGAWLEQNAATLTPADFLLLDPPRAGADPETLSGILALRPQHIAYVSCDPATLARDLRALLAAGYTLDSLAAFDIFPQTHHVETVAHLALAGSS
ncbi:MAG TPA: TRAM domain-containing protein [Pyrinomonadaceae bacterium]|jgi:23S rRNA (uracil1939-C5)-methyltransferase|nr:TRAM domain-containing protein [Pyrinomonadaceae bacterium]